MIIAVNYQFKQLERRSLKKKKKSGLQRDSSTRSEKEANGNSEVKVKSACICMFQAAHQASTYSTFYSMKRLEVFLVPPEWDASPSQGYPQHLICQYLFDTPEWILTHSESKVSRPRTEYNVSSEGRNPDCPK